MFIVGTEAVPEAEWWAIVPPHVSVHAARVTARAPWARWDAARRGVEIGVQQAVNRLVMSHMSDGIVVVDAGGQVVAGNPAAQQMLGLAGDAQF
eukprot:gene55062-75453_t